MEDISVYREIFIEELVEQLEKMDQDLLALEQSESEDWIQSLFRSVHTIKGSSAAMGFNEMKTLTHEMEHVLDLVRCKKLSLGSSLMGILFQTLDFLKLLKNEYVLGGPFSDGAALVSMIRSAAHEPQLSETDGAPEEFEFTLEQELQFAEARENGFQLIHVHLTLSDECQMKAARFNVIMNIITDEGGMILVSDPACDPFAELLDDAKYQHITWVLGVRHTWNEVQSRLADLVDVDFVRVRPLQVAEDQLQSIAKLEEKDDHPNEVGKPTGSQSTSGQTIRVSVERLEHLMNLVGELLIDQTSLTQIKEQLSQRFTNQEFFDRFEAVSDHMTGIISELQESVMKARMLPIIHLFSRFPRMVRDLCKNLAKEVDLVLEGKETELDRTLIEEIGDPLIHLIRNAIDHGIETAEVRESQGKASKGTIKLDAYHEDNQVIITIEDDGAGISPERIKKSALEKGVISGEAADYLTDQEALQLIFKAGFSTASAVTEVSGRGVGMDIVRSQIERLNGQVDIQTELGKGTRFTIRLPLTLAIIVGLMVKVSGRVYAIPMNNVVEIVRIPYDEIQTIHGEQVVVIRNQIIPVVWLYEVLRYSKQQKQPKFVPIVILGSAEKRIALAVDELIGNQEIVIKTMGSYLGKIDLIAGATILGNGRVALILEISYLMKMLGKH